MVFIAQLKIIVRLHTYIMPNIAMLKTATATPKPESKRSSDVHARAGALATCCAWRWPRQIRRPWGHPVSHCVLVIALVVGPRGHPVSRFALVIAPAVAIERP